MPPLSDVSSYNDAPNPFFMFLFHPHAGTAPHLLSHSLFLSLCSSVSFSLSLPSLPSSPSSTRYYEFIDTWVLVAKCSTSNGKRVVPSTLQVYHHAGIALSMWGSTVCQSAWIAWVVIMNSTVHTIMYTYFFASCFGYKSPLAPYLTTLQLVQFFTGIGGTLFVHAIGESCDSAGSRLVLTGLQLYAVGLIFLFAAFFKRKYKSA